MLKIAIIDANERARKGLGPDVVGSVVGGWLRLEIKRAGVCESPPGRADVVLLVHAGNIGWAVAARRGLRAFGIQEDANRRDSPYVITGGDISSLPLVGLRYANAIVVGEAYDFIAGFLSLIKSGCSIDDVRDYAIHRDDVIERAQVSFDMDHDKPWLMRERHPVIATPGERIDWFVPPIKSDDRVVRVIGSKGCHRRCGFCATTWRQKYQCAPDAQRVIRSAKAVVASGQRISIISNDPAAMPWFGRSDIPMDSESFTLSMLRDPERMEAIVRSRVKIARFGIEGLSERIRTAFQKPLSDDEIVDGITKLSRAKINTHMFMIVGAPWERQDDYDAFKELWSGLAKRLDSHILRVKFTAFMPTPPAPLSRFLPGMQYWPRLQELTSWISNNAANRHMFYVSARRGDSHIEDIAEQMSVDKKTASSITGGINDVLDLAPTINDAERMSFEMVSWPQSPESRYAVSGRYKQKMLGAT